MYQKGDLEKYVNRIKGKVKSGKMSKQEANVAILGYSIQFLLSAGVSKKQFMLERNMEAMNYE